MTSLPVPLVFGVLQSTDGLAREPALEALSSAPCPCTCSVYHLVQLCNSIKTSSSPCVKFTLYGDAKESV